MNRSESTRLSEASLEALGRSIAGEVIGRHSRSYQGLSRPYNARFDEMKPQAIVLCASADDVAQTVKFIRSHGWESAVRSGGHCFAGRSLTDGILIDVAPLNSTSVSHGIARVGAGARLGEVYVGLLAQGVTIPAGSCPSVGIAGLTLGGGLGFLGRKYGLTTDFLVGAQIVLADGEIVDCDEHTRPDLFWALRGGGSGHFGIVTQMHFRIIPVPEAVTVFHLAWPGANAGAVARAWLDWTASAPDEIAASLDLRAGSSLDGAPEVELFGAMIGGRSDTGYLLDQIAGRVNAGPATSLIKELTYLEQLRHWAERSHTQLDNPREQPDARPYEFIKSEFFDRPLESASLDALLTNLTDARHKVPFREIDFSPWGGAYNQRPAEATAFPHRSSAYWVKHTARLDAYPSATAMEAARRWVERSWATLHAEGTGHVFPNFADLDLEDWGHAYYGSNYERLLEVKTRYDPDNVFRFRQSLPVRGR
jgi:FAD/FMN-containing dehydrogenase